MSNGRRAWRRWVKNFHKHEGAHTSKGVYWPLSSARLRRHADWTPDSVPPPWSPRSLVGMSMGARKREANRARSAAINLLAGFGKQTDPVKLAMLRSIYRIGERLRPCPGRYGCVNCTRTCGACEDQIPDDTKCPRCGSVMTTEGPFCDGSGTVPARKAKR